MGRNHLDCARAAGLGILFWSLSMSSPAAVEKQTAYRFQNVDFPSLNAADQYMRHNTYFGGRPDPSANWLQFRKRQQIPPGSGDSYLEFGFKNTNYTEEPGVVAYMTTNTAADCNDSCPIRDDFGNDFCSANIWPFCLSDGPIIDKMLELESRPLCPAEVSAYPDYAQVRDNLGGFQVVWQFGNQNPIQASGFAQYKGDLRYTSYFSGCQYPQAQIQSIYPHTSVFCSVGYNLLIRTDAGYRCTNPLVTRIYETGAATPEPTMACGVENPCHPATGSKSLSETDFSSPTLTFTRSYHSMTPYDDYAGLGRGWTHNYAQRILDYPGLSVSAKKLLDGKGNIEHFKCADSPVCTVYRPAGRPGKVLMPITGGWLFRGPNGEQRTFDEEGRLTSIERVEGDYSLLTLNYGAGGRIDAVTDHTGRRLHFYYNQDSLLEALELPSGKLITFEYVDPNPPAGAPVERQNLVKVVREDLAERLYHYEDRSPGMTPRNVFLLTGITDELGVRFATYAYDERARVVLSGHANGADMVTLNYTHRPGEALNWSITEVTNPLGGVITYDMDAGPFRKIQSIVDSRGKVSFSYDSEWAWRNSKTDRAGNKTNWQYDGLHEIRRTEAAGTSNERVVETIWDDSSNRVSMLREQGKTTRFTYNARGQILSRTETNLFTGMNRNWDYTYFEAPEPEPLIGRIRTVDGPRTDVSDVIGYEYYMTDDPEGRYLNGDLKAIVNALGHRTEYLQYDAEGKPMQIRDANGVLTKFGYHARGWLSSRTIDGKTTSYGYDATGNLTRITEPDGNFVQYEYDDAHRLNAIGDSLGNRIEFVLDADGNRTEENTIDDAGILRRQLGRIYDQLGQLTALLDGNGNATRFAYDFDGNITQSADANARVRTFAYDSLDRLVSIIDGMLGETTLDYDSRDNLTSVTDPSGNLTQFVYDGLDNRIEMHSPDSGSAGYEYDAAGNLTVVTNAQGMRIEYGYDALNRLTYVGYPDSRADVNLAYDQGNYGKGHLSRLTDAAGITDYAYDARGNLVLESRAIGSVQLFTAYVYNSADRLVKIIYPSGMEIDYVLDPADRVHRLDQTVDGTSRALVSDVRYEPFGPVKSFRYGNGMTYIAEFDLDYKLHELHSGSGLDWLLDYDPAGNLRAIDDENDARNSQIFHYDELDRLLSASGDYGSEYFEYDANGNRTRYLSDQADESYQYEPRSNRLTMQGGWTYSRNAAGSRIEKLGSSGYGHLYEYSDDNHLIRFGLRDTGGDRPVAAYVNDGRGRRASKTVNGLTTHFVYGPAGELLGVYSDNGEPMAEYIYMNTLPVAVVSAQARSQPETPLEFLIDNDDPGTGSTGKWHLKSDKDNYGDNYQSGKKSGTYRWTPEPLTGTFDIYAWWVAGKKNSSAASYTIRHGEFSDMVTAGQNKGGGEWYYLGTYVFTGSGSEYVELSSGDGKNISADAILFREATDAGDRSVSTSGTYFIHTDHLGSPRQVSNDAQTILWRWESRPFGNSLPDEDPDGDGSKFSLNLRFPGQYFDQESGLNYNYYRTFDPSAGRYLESDPIGFKGGANSFSYGENNPVEFIDPFGLSVSGQWIRQPKLNVTDYGLTGARFIRPHLNEWGFLKALRIYGYASGYVNLDVRCSNPDDCESGDWEIHKSIGVSYSGYKDLGPNAAAIGAGSVAGPLAGLVTGIFTLGGSAMTSLLEILQEVEAHGGDKIQWLYRVGPTAICQGIGK